MCRLRRAVLHPSFVTGKAALLKKAAGTAGEDVDVDMDAFASTALETLDSTTQDECPICFDLIQNPVLLPNCKHCWCACCHLHSLSMLSIHAVVRTAFWAG